MSIRTKLMEELHISSKQASKLIKAYARNHSGKIDVNQIIEDIRSLSNKMIYEVGQLDFDVRHEILRCGKQRQQLAVYNMLGDEESENLAAQYLLNQYYENVDDWAHTFYSSAQSQIQTILDSEIEHYRDFVSSVPSHNIYRVARAFNMERNIVEFLAKNGTIDDFKHFMSGANPSKGKGKVKKYPDFLCEQLFQQIQDSVNEGSFKHFDRAELLKGLSFVHRNSSLTDSQKIELQELFSYQFFRDKINDDRCYNLMRASFPNNFEFIKNFLEVASELNYYEKEELLKQPMCEDMEEEFKSQYSALLEKLDESLEKGELDLERFTTLLNSSGLSQYERIGIYSRKENEELEEGEIEIVALATNPVTGKEMYISQDGSRLSEIIGYVNERSKENARNQLERFASGGRGEISAKALPYYDSRFRNPSEYAKNNGIIAALTDDEHSPYVVGGMPKGELLSPIEVVVPFKQINPMFPFIRISSEETMSPEQIKRFNHQAEPVDVQTHSYRYSRVDGYYSNVVYDFNMNGETYHVKRGYWPNSGSCTVVWKGEEKDYPDEGISILVDGRGEYARNQAGVPPLTLIQWIAETPRKFSRYYDENCGIMSCVGTFPSETMQRVCHRMLALPRESDLQQLEKQSSELLDILPTSSDLEQPNEQQSKLSEASSKQENISRFATIISNLATRKAQTDDTARRAKDLLSEYEKIEARKPGNNVDK